MSEQVVAPGDKLHIMTRRLFPDDLRRHFAGEVIRVAGELCELNGYAFVFHPSSNEYQKRPKLRTRVFSLGDAIHIVNKLPRDLKVDELAYRIVDGRLVVSDDSGFLLEINEFGSNA